MTRAFGSHRVEPEDFETLARKYASHPEFFGIQLSDPNQPGALDDTLLHLAARTGALADVEALVVAGARVNVIGDFGNTPLHLAAMGGHVEVVMRLLSLGADPTIKNEFYQTALHVAELSSYDVIAALLTEARSPYG